jgi:hypothetical protein
LIETRYRSADHPAIIGVEFDCHADRTPGELGKALGRPTELQPLDDTPIQLEQFVFGQFRDVEHHTTRCSISAV